MLIDIDYIYFDVGALLGDHRHGWSADIASSNAANFSNFVILSFIHRVCLGSKMVFEYSCPSLAVFPSWMGLGIRCGG